MDRSHQNLQRGLPFSSLALPLPGEAQCSNPGYSSSPTILPLPGDRLTSSSQHQQSGLQDSSVPITTLPRKTLLVERTSFQMEWEAPKGQVRSSYHQLRCLPTRLGAACVKNCTGGAWSVQEQTMHINCLEYLAAMLSVKTFLKDISGVLVLLQMDSGLHQQRGRHSVKPADRSGKGTMNVGTH